LAAIRQNLSILPIALLAGCASRAVPPSANVATHPVRYAPLPDFQGLALLDSTEEREKPLRTVRLRDSASSRWCLACGSPADSTVQVRVWGVRGGRKEFEDSILYARTNLPRARSIDHFLGRPQWNRASRTLHGWLEPNAFLEGTKLWPESGRLPERLASDLQFEWRHESLVRLHPPHVGLIPFGGTYGRFLLTPLVTQDGADVLEVEGRLQTDQALRWRRRLSLACDTLQCDSLDSLTLCVELQRRAPRSRYDKDLRFPETPPWPDRRRTCWGVPGAPWDAVFQMEREYAEEWNRHHEFHLPPDAFCRLEQLVSRVPDVECKPEPAQRCDPVPIMEGNAIKGHVMVCRSRPEEIFYLPEPPNTDYLEIMGRSSLRWGEDCRDLPGPVMDDWSEIYELLRFADCRRKHPGDTIQCREPGRMRP